MLVHCIVRINEDGLFSIDTYANRDTARARFLEEYRNAGYLCDGETEEEISAEIQSLTDAGCFVDCSTVVYLKSSLVEE